MYMFINFFCLFIVKCWCVRLKCFFFNIVFFINFSIFGFQLIFCIIFLNNDLLEIEIMKSLGKKIVKRVVQYFYIVTFLFQMFFSVVILFIVRFQFYIVVCIIFCKYSMFKVGWYMLVSFGSLFFYDFLVILFIFVFEEC